jgi:hypothetical protein
MLHIENGTMGVTFLGSCNDAKTCPFSVVASPSDIKKMGDIRQLEGNESKSRGRFRITTGATKSYCGGRSS